MINRMLYAVAAVVVTILYTRWWSWAWLCCVCRIFPRDQSVHLRTQQRESAEKSEMRDVKRVDFIRYWRRSGL